LHSKNIAHRDIKPDNSLIFQQHDKFCLYKLCDFGISSEIDMANTATVRNLKTRGYASPEQMENQKSNIESDYWALGIIFY